MSKYNLLSPRLIDADLRRPNLRKETKLALKTLKELLLKAHADVDDGIVHEHIEAALGDPAMDNSAMAKLCSERYGSVRTLFDMVHGLEKNILRRQHESGNDVRSLVTCLNSMIVTPIVANDDETLRGELIQDAVQSLKPDTLHALNHAKMAMHHLTKPLPDESAQLAPTKAQSAPSVGSPMSTSYTSPMSTSQTSPMGASSQIDASQFGASNIGAPSLGASPPLDIFQVSPPKSLSSDDSLSWVDEMTSPTVNSNGGQPVVMASVGLPYIFTMHVVAWDTQSETIESFVHRLGLSMYDVTHFWKTKYSFDTAPLMNTLHACPLIIEVPPRASVAAEVQNIEFRVISKLEPDFPTMTKTLYDTIMSLLSFSHHHSSPELSIQSETGEKRLVKRRDFEAPQPPPHELTERHICLNDVLKNIDLNQILDRQPMLRRRTVYSKTVVDWCIVFKRVAEEHVRVYLLNDKPNNRYATVDMAELFFPDDFVIDTIQGRQSEAFAALPMPKPHEVYWADTMFSQPLFVNDIGSDGPKRLFAENVFGMNYLFAGWYSTHHAEDSCVKIYISKNTPRLVYIYKETTTAIV